MACLEYWASPEEYCDFFCVEIHGEDEPDQVKNYLRRAASTINMAMQASGACDCTLSAVSTAYLRDLSIVLAVVYHNCTCARPNLSVEEKRLYLEQVQEELRLIRTGEHELCDGATGADFPALGWAEQSLTDHAAARIIYNAGLRG
jgi:hypothetical protein